MIDYSDKGGNISVGSPQKVLLRYGILTEVALVFTLILILTNGIQNFSQL